MSDRAFRYEEGAGIARITLDRPASLNSLTFETYADLVETFRGMRGRSDVRAVVITGTGRAFCTGGDVKEIIEPLLAKGIDDLRRFARMTCDLVQAMREAPQPIVAALNGTVAGAGAAIAVAADFRIAAEEAKIAFLFVRVGLAGADMGMCRLLPSIVGLGRATELLMLGDFIDAREAHRIGLYNRVVAAQELAAEASALAARIGAGPARALAATKRALRDELSMDLASALDYEARLQADLMTEADFREGFAAFREKRLPRFEGAPE